MPTIFRRLAVAGFAAALLWTLIGGGAFPSSVAGASEENEDLADYLRLQPVVFMGTLQGVDTIPERMTIASCGSEPYGPMFSLDLTIAVTRVYQGSLDESLTTIGTYGQRQFLPGEAPIGSTVLVWAGRRCEDGWQLWGDFAVITPAGTVLGSLQNRGAMYLKSRPVHTPLPLSALDSALSVPSLPSLYSPLESADGIGLVRVHAGTQSGSGAYIHPVDSLSVLMGSVPRMPRYLRLYAPIHGCLHFGDGDSLLVPLHEGGPDTLSIGVCTDGLMTRNRFVPGLGVSLTMLHFAVRPLPTTSIKPIHSPN